jgi:hypothetical protein
MFAATDITLPTAIYRTRDYDTHGAAIRGTTRDYMSSKYLERKPLPKFRLRI